MPPNKPEGQVTFNVKVVAVTFGLLVSVVTAGYGLTQWGSGYHEQFALDTAVNQQVSDINKEIITLAIQSKEDDLSLIEFKQATGQATDLDTADKANIERRLESLQGKLDKLEE